MISFVHDAPNADAGTTSVTGTSASTPGNSDCAALPTNLRATRHKSGVTFQADFRAYKDIGGRRIILCEPGSKIPVRCPERAKRLFQSHIDRLNEIRDDIGYTKLGFDPTLGPAAQSYLISKKHGGEHADGSIESEAAALCRFVIEFDNPRLSEITGPRLEAYIRKRKQEPGARLGTTISPSTIRLELMALSGLFKRAKMWKLVTCNPVDDVTTKPKAAHKKYEVTFLTEVEAARLLDAAARIDAETREAKAIVADYLVDRACGEPSTKPSAKVFAAARRFPWCEAVIATFLYTGGRLMEVLGLAVEDVDFERNVVRFRQNDFRKLKKRHHRRLVELPPPLADILRHYLAESGRTSGLLFTSAKGKMMKAFTKPFARCVERAGLLEPGRHITRHALRHTFATHLLCTWVRSEDGRRVERSSDSVRRRLGHRTTQLVETVYGHETLGMKRRKRLSFERTRELPAHRLRAPQADAA